MNCVFRYNPPNEGVHFLRSDFSIKRKSVASIIIVFLYLFWSFIPPLSVEDSLPLVEPSRKDNRTWDRFAMNALFLAPFYPDRDRASIVRFELRLVYIS